MWRFSQEEDRAGAGLDGLEGLEGLEGLDELEECFSAIPPPSPSLSEHLRTLS